MIKYHSKFDDEFVGGKTGTPERKWVDSRGKVDNHFNDGWYICFIEGADISDNNKDKDCLAVAVRIERIGKAMSGRAVKLTKDVVIKTLKELN